MNIFIAGATGAVGLPLVRALRAQGHRVTGMTRPGPGVDRLRELGAEASTADAFNVAEVRRALEAAKPEVFIDQLTWLPPSPADIIKAMPNDTRLHREGGANLPAPSTNTNAGSSDHRRWRALFSGMVFSTAPAPGIAPTARLRIRPGTRKQRSLETEARYGRSSTSTTRSLRRSRRLLLSLASITSWTMTRFRFPNGSRPSRAGSTRQNRRE